MPTYLMDSKQFDTVIDTNDIVFVDFWAEWCSPCKQFAIVYERVAEQTPTIKFTKVNIEEESELAERFEIRSIPHLMIFKKGILIYSDAGSMPESTLNDLVVQALSIDVSEIRAKIDLGEV
ncbi:MAG: thiol reductase thioredoxin [Tatlockia sp.]|nr:thiol reductase thioredoxin [Tatlockia sp.]